MNINKLLLLTAALSTLAAQASANLITTLNTSGVDAFDRYTQDERTPGPIDGTGDFLSAPLNVGLNFPGKLNGGDRRQLWDFDLPELSVGQSVTSATLTFRLGNITAGSPDFSILGSLVGTGTTGTASLYESANYSTSIGSFADGDDNTTFNLNVLPFILANYAADGGDTWASFRIQSDDVSGAFANHNAQLGGLNQINTSGPNVGSPHGLQVTQLSLTTIPEPSTLGLLGVGGLVMRFFRRRRS